MKLVKINILGLALFGLTSCGGSELVSEIGQTTRGSTCYSTSALSDWVWSGGYYEAYGNITDDFIGNERYICADNWQFGLQPP